jgi:hypothetical protein
VIGFIPKSPVRVALPTELLSGLDRLGGVVAGVVLDPMGTTVLRITDPSLGQRMLYLATTLPALLLVGEIARRMSNLLRAGRDTDAHQTPLGWLAVGLIFAGFAQLIARGVDMRAELDTVI